MRKIILFIATSLDGYIARPDGAVDWLFTEGDFGYEDFYKQIDTTLMGRKTYEQVLTFGEFPYPDKQNYVFSHRSPAPGGEHVTFISKDVVGFIRDLKTQNGKDIWLIGGGGLIQTCLDEHLVDELRVFVHPILLCAGLPLVSGSRHSASLQLLSQRTHDKGLVELHYAVQKPA